MKFSTPDEHADILHYERNVKEIMSFLNKIEYTIFRVQMDQKGKHFMGLTKITALPIQVWTWENAHECDYILIPTDKIHDYARLVERTMSSDGRGQITR